MWLFVLLASTPGPLANTAQILHGDTLPGALCGVQVGFADGMAGVPGAVANVVSCRVGDRQRALELSYYRHSGMLSEDATAQTFDGPNVLAFLAVASVDCGADGPGCGNPGAFSPRWGLMVPIAGLPLGKRWHRQVISWTGRTQTVGHDLSNPSSARTSTSSSLITAVQMSVRRLATGPTRPSVTIAQAPHSVAVDMVDTVSLIVGLGHREMWPQKGEGTCLHLLQ